MSEPGFNRSREEPETEQAWERLFREAGPRERPPIDDEREIKDALLEEWDALAGRRVLRWRFGVAVAAAALAAAAVLLLPFGPAEQRVAIAHIERVSGAVTVEGPAESRLAAVGDVLANGSMVATGDGGLALRLAANGSLRLAPGTRLELIAAAEMRLLTGMLYFDSERDGSLDRAASLRVHVPGGVVQDVGTQFLVRVGEDLVEVGVRRGSVAVTRGEERASAAAGERLIVPEGRGGIRRDSIDPLAAEWRWTEALAPPFAIDGRPLVELLEWVATQTGRSVRYTDREAERLARDTLLRGSVDLEPLPKLAAVLATTDLTHRIDGSTILIEPK